MSRVTGYTYGDLGTLNRTTFLRVADHTDGGSRNFLDPRLGPITPDCWREVICVVSGVRRPDSAGERENSLIAGAFPIQPLGLSRSTLAGRLLLWGLVFRVPASPQ